MKTFFVIALVLLVVLIGIRYWLDRERAAERARLGPVSEAYKAREAALLKSRTRALDAITKIVPSHGANAATPGASPAPATPVVSVPPASPTPGASSGTPAP